MDAFEAWLEHLFDRGADEFDWYLGDSRPTEWTLRYEQGDTPVAQAERIRRLFSDAGTLLRLASRVWQSRRLTVVARIRTRSASSLGAGRSTCSMRRTPGGP